MPRFIINTDREERILKLADKHVIVARHIVAADTCRSAAYRAAKKLRTQGRLRAVGFVRGVSGRPEIAYCNSWRPRSNQLLHEVRLTDFLLCYAQAEIVRGWQVDSRIRPDAEMTLGGQKFFVELDTGEQSYRQVEQRQRAYESVKELLLYVTSTETRLAGLMQHSSAVRSIAFFTTLDRVLRDPQGEVWTDCFGNVVSLTKGAL